MQGELWRRSRLLIKVLWGEVLRVDPEPVRLVELIALGCDTPGPNPGPQGSQHWSRKTVENTIRDMAAFGLVRVKERGRDRVVSATPLGLAWRAQVLLPLDLSATKKAYEEVSGYYDRINSPMERAVRTKMAEVEGWLSDGEDEWGETEDWTPEPPGVAELAAAVEVDLG